MERRKKEDMIIFPMYPKTVPKFPVRADPYSATGEPVSRGRLDRIGGFPDLGRDKQVPHKRYTVKEFKEALQCSEGEPALNDNYGTLSLMLLSPPTRESIELIAAWAEKDCGGSASDWTSCRRELEKLKKGGYPAEFKTARPHKDPFQMVRIINNELYQDWPWGVERISPRYGLSTMFELLAQAVSRLSDLGDSVFLFGGEHPVVPWTFPIAHLSMAGSMEEFAHSTNTIVWPWEQEFTKEKELYQHISTQKFNDFSDESVRQATSTLSWDQKTDTRAAFYASFDMFRFVIMEQAARHPDLFDFAMNQPYNLFCWTPECTYWNLEPAAFANFSRTPVAEPKQSGVSLLPYASQPPKHYNPGQYKYVVVPLGMGGMSTSSRLLYLLAHCECVVLLVSSQLQYHISARLVPWVHYVPLAASGADVAVKVRWLQQHDDLARQIAENGYNFGKSYLRYEDYLCFAASTAEALGVVMANTTALQPFSPRKITLY